MDIATALQYSETGEASIYNDGGSIGAMGERLPKGGKYAAHRTLPLSSVVRVTSVSTGKSCEVRCATAARSTAAASSTSARQWPKPSVAAGACIRSKSRLFPWATDPINEYAQMKINDLHHPKSPTIKLDLPIQT